MMWATPLMWPGLGPAVPLWLSAALSGLLALGCISLVTPGRSGDGRDPTVRTTRRRRGRRAGAGRPE